MNGHERRQGRRLQSLLTCIYVVATTWVFATTALAVATVELSTSDAVPGGTVTLTMRLSGEAGDPAFAGAQVDVIIDRSQLGIDAQCSESGLQCDSGLDCEDVGACVLIDCEADARFPAQSLIANSPRFQNVPTIGKRIRLGIVAPGLSTFGDGTLLTCDLNVLPNAGFGLQNLSTDPVRLVVSDGAGNIIPSQVVIVPGRIIDPTELTPVATATPTSTPIGGDETPTSTSTPVSTSTIGTSTPTTSPTPPGGGSPTITPTQVGPTATRTGTTGATPTATSTAVQGGGGGSGDGCNCAITPEADTSKGTALMWLSLFPIALLGWRRSRDL